MSAAHTPGPWTYSRSDQFGDTRFYIAQQEGAPYTPRYSDVATLIAETVSLELLTIQEANARLISAAPELLAALEAIMPDAVGNHIGGPDTQARIDAARAAIAKATGSAQ